MIKYFSNFIEIVIHVNLDLILVRLENVFAVERKVVAGVEHLCAVFQLGATVILFQLGQQARKNVTRLVGVIASLVELVAFSVFSEIFGECHADLREVRDLV